MTKVRAATTSMTAPTPKKKVYKGQKPFTVTWTNDDSRAANKQGWDIFDATDRYELEVVTEHPAGFGDGDDDSVVAWLIQRACKGDALAAKGLIVCMLLDPQWTGSDISHAVTSGRVTIRGPHKRTSIPRSTLKHRTSVPLKEEE